MSQPGNDNADLSKLFSGLNQAAGVIGSLKTQFEKSITPELIDSLDPITRAKFNGYISEIDMKSAELANIKPQLDKAMEQLNSILTKQGT